MKYHYSHVLHPSELETDGLCDGLPTRQHVAADLEEIGTFRAQEDWKDLVAPISGYKGGLGPRYNFMAVSLPECLPDRFEIVSYANEFAFLHDDVTDILSQQEGGVENDKVLGAFREGAQDGVINSLKSGKRQIQAKILNAMISIDRPRALIAMRAWTKFLEQGAGRQHHRNFRSLDEYLPYRTKDVGHMFWHALVTFGCAITIPEEETAMCENLVMPAVIAASLTNDLFSYDKEYEAAQAADLPGVVNALWVLMNEHRVSLEEAKIMCRTRVKEEVAKYIHTVHDTIARPDVSLDAKRYIELMQYSVSGNVLWSMQCPRYHKDMQYNERQILRAIDGIAKHPTTYTRDDRQEYVTSDSVNLQDQPVPSNKAKTDTCTKWCDEATGRRVSPPDTSSPGSKEDDNWDVSGLACGAALRSLGEDIILEPYHYVSSLPSKGVRDMVIDALQVWLDVPPHSTAAIRRVIKKIHNSSIMLDDLQDGSQMRRGNPSTHLIFGEAQTINCATFQYLRATAELRQLANPACLDIFIDEMRSLFVGQGFDLHWTSRVECPSLVEYLQMVDGKTGGLFRLLARLMAAESPHGNRVDINRLCRLLGRYYQIRDDYQNLVSEEYTVQKGFCEDLDEGKFSLPLIHALAHTDKPMQLSGLLHERRRKGLCSKEQKACILKFIRDAGSLTYVLQVLRALHAELDAELRHLEDMFGRDNHEMRLMLALVKL
ncbi:terpenoid synthase [Xylaria venustula]|nr:terpenoid synthase [Xylaria venustula]